MAEVIPQITVDSSKVKNTWVQNEVVTNDVYNAINKAVIDLKNNNNLLDTNAILFREQYNSSSKNLNNAIHQGIYSFTNSAVNAPSGVTGGNLFVTNTSKINQGSSVITQIAFCHNGAVYARTKNTSENFTSWKRLAFTESPTFSGTPTAPTAGTSTNNTQIATTGFVHNYAPSKTGSGATGTWGINISGNAKVLSETHITGNTTGGNLPFGTTWSTINNNNFPCNYGNCLSIRGSGAIQIAVEWVGSDATAGRMFFRNARDVSLNSWSPWREIAYTTGNIASATKATQDSEGKPINTTYLKRSGGTMSGALNLANKTLNLVGDDCYFGDQDVAGGFCLKGANGTTNLTFIKKDDTAKKASLSYAGGNLISSATIQGNLSGTATKATNADNSTKATQDSQGQQINTTYVKSVTGSNATLTITKGNGTTSSVTVNNVSHATSADSSTNTGNFNQGFQTNEKNFPTSTFRQTILGRSGPGICARPFCGKFPTNTGLSCPGMAFGGIDTHGFIQVDYGSPIVYVGGGSTNKINWCKKLAITDSPAFSGTPTAPTPSTSDNSTRIATTAFVKSLFTASKATNGWWRDGNTGMIWQWGFRTGGSGINSYHVNFPITFPNMAFIAGGFTASSVGTFEKNTGGCSNLTKSGADFSFENVGGYWLAIGY